MMQKLKSWFDRSILPKYRDIISAKQIFSYDLDPIPVEFIIVQELGEFPLYSLDKVYQVNDINTHTPYILKRFKPSIATFDLENKSEYTYDAQTLYTAVQNELNFFKSLPDHQFINVIHDIFETDSVLVNLELYREVWIQYEFGHISLHRLLATQQSKIHLDQVAALCAQLLEVISFLGELNIAHSELTTKNILLFQPGIVKITNFCFAVDVKETETELLPIEGPVYYSAPEKIRKLYLQKNEDSAYLSLRYDTKIDVWSLGIVLLEIFIKAPPLFRATCVTQELRDKYVTFLADLASPHRNKGSALYHLFYPHYDLLKEQIEAEEISDLELLKAALPLEKSNIDSLIVLMGFKESDRYRAPTETLIPRFDKLYTLSSYFDFIRQCLFLPPNLRPNALVLRKHNFVKASSEELGLFLENFSVRDLQMYWTSREYRKNLFADFKLNLTVPKINELLNKS